MRKAAVLVLMSGGALAAVPSVALAATVECEEINPRYGICEVVYVEEPGEVNQLQVRVSGNTVSFRDRVRVRAGRGCVQLEPRRARCTIGSEPVLVGLGRRGDSMGVRGEFGPGPALQAALGEGDDVFTGGSGSDGVDGGRGADRLRGRGGDDSLVSGGEDRANDVVEGGSGDDSLQGDNGTDRLVGGPGFDSMVGEGGRDHIHAHDGEIDQVFCGAAAERPLVDFLDWVSRRCRVRPRPMAAAVPLGRDFSEADVDFKDHLYLVGCPADGPPRCRGRVEVRSRGRLLLAGRFRARRGSMPLISLREPAAFVRPKEPRRVLTRVAVLSRDRRGRRAVRVARVPFLIDDEEGIR